MIKHEAILQQQIVNYLKYQYPDILFRSDFASGMKLSIGQATRHKQLQSGRAWPDLFIAKPMNGKHGLFIELKADSAPLYKKNGDLVSSQHIQEQAGVLNELRRLGYDAHFGQGYEQTVDIIDKYMGTTKNSTDF